MIISVKTVTGDIVFITEQELISAILDNISQGNFSLLGMSLSSIVKLRSEYLKLGGGIPITPESINLIFQPAK